MVDKMIGEEDKRDRTGITDSQEPQQNDEPGATQSLPGEQTVADPAGATRTDSSTGAGGVDPTTRAGGHYSVATTKPPARRYAYVA